MIPRYLSAYFYYEFPENDEAYKYEGEYMFGNDILVAPVTEAAVNGLSKKEIWFPAGNWWSVSTNELIEGPCVKTMEFTQNRYLTSSARVR